MPKGERPLRVVVCYTLVNGYMAACWRELAQRDDIELFVIGFASGRSDLVAFPADIMDGVPSLLLTEEERANPEIIGRVIVDAKPNILFISGWFHKGYRKLFSNPRLRDTRIVLMMDNQFRGDWRQFFGRFVLRRLMRRVSCVFVTGDRSFQFARYMGIDSRRIQKGVVSVDHKSLSSLFDERLTRPGGWPKSFLFVGRYHERKGIDILVEGYRLYRERVTDPWPLRTAGMGPLAAILAHKNGIQDLGFVAPSAMREVWRDAGAFVLPSRYDAWPLVNVEAAAAGLPVVCTDVCGSSVETVSHRYTGLVIPSEDPGALANALLWIHRHYKDLPEMGRRGRELAGAYSAQVWADRVEEIVHSICANP